MIVIAKHTFPFKIFHMKNCFNLKVIPSTIHSFTDNVIRLLKSNPRTPVLLNDKEYEKLLFTLTGIHPKNIILFSEITPKKVPSLKKGDVIYYLQTGKLSPDSKILKIYESFYSGVCKPFVIKITDSYKKF
jgi:hypothetical protein